MLSSQSSNEAIEASRDHQTILGKERSKLSATSNQIHFMIVNNYDIADIIYFIAIRINPMYECAQSSITFNNLNLPSYDLHSKEGRDQILFNLHTLNQSFLKISGMHLAKSKEQQDRIERLKERIQKCRLKILGLETSNTAIIFVSPSQYPKKYEFNPQNNISRFNEYLNRTNIQKLDMNALYSVKHNLSQIGKQSKFKLAELDNFVMFMMGQLKGKRKNLFDKGIGNKKTIESLGRIPATIKYIDSLTVFNTHINPYRKYEVIDNEIVFAKNKKQATKDLDVIQIDKPIQSFSKPEFDSQAMNYKPQEKDLEMPDFDLDLDLGGIVDLTLEPVNNTTANVKEGIKKKAVVNDPYAGKSQTNPNPTAQTNTNMQPPPALNTNLPPSLPNNLLPPPPPTLGTLPPPPTLGLPPPPTLNLPLPPPPTLNLALPIPPAPPGLGLPPGGLLPPPPALPNMAAAPALPKAAGSRAALLQEIENPNPMSRLRKVVTKQSGGIKPANQSSSAGSGEGNGDQPPKPSGAPMSLMEALQAKIRSRFKQLHPEKQDSDGE